MRVGLPANTPKAELSGPGKAQAPSLPSVRSTSDSRRAARIEMYWAPMSKYSRLNDRPMLNGSLTSTLALNASSSSLPAGAGEKPEVPKPVGVPKVGFDSAFEK